MNNIAIDGCNFNTDYLEKNKVNYIHFFGPKSNNNHSYEDNIKDLLGGKGAGLMIMSNKLSVSIPSGFIIDTTISKNF